MSKNDDLAFENGDFPFKKKLFNNHHGPSVVQIARCCARVICGDREKRDWLMAIKHPLNGPTYV